MRKAILACIILAVLAGCTGPQINQALSTPAGGLFCAIQTKGGGTMLVNVIDAAASAALPGAAPVFVLAAGAAKANVDDACTRAAVAANGTGGSPVSPPSMPIAVPNVAIPVPIGMPTAPAAVS